MTLQQQLLKAKWQKCTCVPYFEEHLDRKKNNKSDCNMCQGTCIQPQIFDNEFDIYEDEKRAGSYLDKPKYKSGDVISICPKCGLENYKDNRCSVKPIQFKVLRTLENNSKIEVLKI